MAHESVTDPPLSTLSWLDFDQTAGDRVARLLRATQDSSTLDPLGLGSLRDGYADVLHPGTSTIQTRLRYFLFLPWIFQALQDEKVPAGHFARRLRERELALIEVLRQGAGPDQGVIGYASREKLVRFPSVIYWGGLRSWAFRQLDLSIGEYARVAAALGRAQPDRDDDGQTTHAVRRMWAPITSPPEGFLREPIDFALRPQEAEDVVQLIGTSHPGSLLGALTAEPEVAAEANWPWELPDRVVPAHLQSVVEHAHRLSQVTWGPQLAYNLQLAKRLTERRAVDTEDFQETQRRQLVDWAAELHNNATTLEHWAGELDLCFEQVYRPSRVKEPTRSFVRFVVTRALSDPGNFADDPAVQQQLSWRERQLKGRRARLTDDNALSDWNQQPFGDRLRYRWPTARGYLADLAIATGRLQEA